MWYEYPNMKDNWDNTTDYIIFIDENNSINSYNIVNKKLINGEEISPNDNIFTVTGCIFIHEKYDEAKYKFNDLRNKYWKDGKYYNSKKNKYEVVCFHSEDIRGRKKAFHNEILNDVQFNNFINDLDQIILSLDYKIISININLKDYILKSKYKETNVYKIAFNFILERFVYNMKSNDKGCIIFEARGKKEDRFLLEHIDLIINRNGTEFIKSKQLKKCISGVYFNKKFGKNNNPYVGLEIADLSSYPIHRYIKFNTIGKDLKTISNKIIGYPNIYGKGIKIYPKK